MNCIDVERAIVELGDEVPDAIRGHVSGCPACRQFAVLHQVLLVEVAGPVPAAALDARIRAAAHRRLGRGWRVLRRGRPAWLAAAAAAVVVCAGVTWILGGPRPAGPLAAGRGPIALRPAAGLHSWAVAQADLSAIEDGLEAALAELGSLGVQGPAASGSVDSDEPWDPLMELELDVYFESQNLRPAGG